jgi:hypothetical protein
VRKESCSRSKSSSPAKRERNQRDINMNYEGPNILFLQSLVRKKRTRGFNSSPNTSSSTIHAQNARSVLTVLERVPWYIHSMLDRYQNPTKYQIGSASSGTAGWRRIASFVFWVYNKRVTLSARSCLSKIITIPLDRWIRSVFSA